MALRGTPNMTQESMQFIRLQVKYVMNFTGW